eukprot:TRINITY_DN17960_c0_g4_i1.p1 TRINITY_DN17960_c0_g4~~TRINITY_DN17960_c0_g4_i1.p1  ORF type:complete len:364 (-),score=36.31 TRINITY_DN17960_c0_g4_i1:723-1814(-)
MERSLIQALVVSVPSTTLNTRVVARHGGNPAIFSKGRPRRRGPSFTGKSLPSSDGVLPGSQRKTRALHSCRVGCRSALKTEGESQVQKHGSVDKDIREALPVESDRNGNGSSSHDIERSGSQKSEGVSNTTAMGGSVIAVLLVLATIAAVGGLGYAYRDKIEELILYFEGYIQELGPLGYVYFVAGYALLEMLAIPAIPLTMSAGLLFGIPTGTLLVSIAGTIAATGAFLIARYVARDRLLEATKDNKKFQAIDRAVGDDSFRVVTLLRLSPLLPFSLGNYLYGLTSVKLRPYVLGSWVGMLPGTWAYVSAGSFGRSLLDAQEGQPFQGTSSLISLGLGVTATLVAAAYVTNVAKTAIKDVED